MRENRSRLYEFGQRMIRVSFLVIVPMWVVQGMFARMKHFETICIRRFYEIPSCMQRVVVCVRLDWQHELPQRHMSIGKRNDSQLSAAIPDRWDDRQF